MEKDLSGDKKIDLSWDKKIDLSWDKKFTAREAGLKVMNVDLDPELVQTLWDVAYSKLAEKPEFKMFNKTCHMRRNIGFFSDISDGYKFSNQKRPAQPLTEEMKTLLEKVNTLTGIEFNGLLFNLYLDGNDYISPHRDNQKDLTDHGVVALSFGVGRTFRVREYKSKKMVCNIVTGDSELMWMTGPKFHIDYTHEVPIEKSITKPRLSITFRKHVEKP